MFNWLSRPFHAFRRAFKALSLNDEKAWNPSLWNLAGSQSLSGENVTEETALTYSAVWNAVNLISGTIGSLPLHLMQKRDKTSRIADDQRIYQTMHTRWNPYMTAMAGRECLMAHVLTWGNGYAEKAFNGTGDLTALWPITPNRVTPEMKENELVYRIKMPDQQDIILPREKILHIPGLGFDGFLGYSVVSMARKSIGLGMAMESFGSLYFGKGTHPGAIVTHPHQVKDPKAFREAVSEVYSGLGQSHQLMLLEDGMTFTQVGIPPEDSQFLECVTPETLVTMADGTRKAAKYISVGDDIISWESDAVSISRISAIGKPKTKNLIKIRTARGRELIASEDHPCLAIQKLRTPGCRVPKKSPAKWTPIKDLKIGSYVRIALDITFIKGLSLTKPPNWISFRTGYFLGAMAGDGYIRKGGCSFTSADNGVTSRMKEIVKAFGGELKEKAHEFNKYNHDIITNGKSGCKGSYIRNLLNDSGMVGKHSDTKTVPKTVLMGRPDAWRGFLSGYFDTDGSIRKITGKQTPAMYWSSTSLNMLEECQHLLAMLGIQSSIYPMSKGGTKKIMGKVCNCLPSWGLYIMGLSQLKKAAETLSLSHTEKVKRLKAYLTTEPSRYREENFLYDRVVSIEELGEGETIGIEVADCHTHVTSGIITHNSRQFQIPEIARWFNLPPHKLKDLTKSSFNNIESEQISFVTDSILPWLVRLEQNFNMQLLTDSERALSGRGRLYFRHIVEGLLRANSKDRAEYYKLMVASGLMTPNEVREKEDMNPSTDPLADELWMPTGLIPMSRFEEYLSKNNQPEPKALPEPKPKGLKLLKEGKNVDGQKDRNAS